jgi:hypothetical protein
MRSQNRDARAEFPVSFREAKGLRVHKAATLGPP